MLKDPYITSVWNAQWQSPEWVNKLVSAIEANNPGQDYIIYLHHHHKGEGCTVGCRIRTSPKTPEQESSIP